MAQKKTGRTAAEAKPLTVTTTISMPADLYRLIEDAARAIAWRVRQKNVELPKGERQSSRPNVSGVIVSVLNKHRDEIAKMAKE